MPNQNSERHRSEAVTSRLQQARVARLATVDEKGRPHVIPICYVYDGAVFYTAVDAKPKRPEGKQLARVKNIQANPHVALLVDEYHEDWNRLWYILVRATATLIEDGDEKKKAFQLLKEKYANYRTGWLPKDALILELRPQRIISWGKF